MSDFTRWWYLYLTYINPTWDHDILGGAAVWHALLMQNNIWSLSWIFRNYSEPPLKQYSKPMEEFTDISTIEKWKDFDFSLGSEYSVSFIQHFLLFTNCSLQFFFHSFTSCICVKFTDYSAAQLDPCLFSELYYKCKQSGQWLKRTQGRIDQSLTIVSLQWPRD